MAQAAPTRRQDLREAREAAAQRQQRIHRIATWAGGVVVLALVVAIAAVVVHAARTGVSTAGDGEVVTPAHVSAGGAVEVGRAAAPVTVRIFYDYMCPACGAFEEANSGELSRLVRSGAVRIELRPLSFLDRMSSGTEYSTRAASAFATVVDAAPGRAWDFHNALYEAQPAEGSTGLSDQQLSDLAVQAGVPGQVAGRFGDHTYEGWVDEVTRMAFEGGVDKTPTVQIDGVEFTGDLFTPGPLTDAIEAAAHGRRP